MPTKKSDVVMHGDLLEAFETEFSWTNVDNLSTLTQWYVSYKVSDEVPLPSEGKGTALICYEMVLYLAAKSGAISKDELKTLYDAHYVKSKSWENVLDKGTTEKVYSTSKHSPRPERGDVVFFNGMGHVALATGAKQGEDSGCLSFWGYVPIPTTEGKMTVPTKIEETTLEALEQYIVSNGPKFQSGKTFDVKVTFRNPPW